MKMKNIRLIKCGNSFALGVKKVYVDDGYISFGKRYIITIEEQKVEGGI